MKLDWGDGDYSTTARQLEPAARRVLQIADIQSGESVLDLGCGNGNATLLAARKGAQVFAVDPSQRLLDAAARRVRSEGLAARFAIGEGAQVPAADASFDVVVAVFSVIFAPDADACVREMLRVLRSRGRIVIASWVSDGAIHDIANLLRPPGASSDTPPWPFPERIRQLFSSYAVDVSIEEAALPFESSSAQAWFEDMESNHPFWRMMKVARADEWPGLKSRSIEVLERANETPGAFRTTSRYLVTRVDRG